MVSGQRRDTKDWPPTFHMEGRMSDPPECCWETGCVSTLTLYTVDSRKDITPVIMIHSTTLLTEPHWAVLHIQTLNRYLYN